METGPFDLDEIRVILGRDGDAAIKAVGPNFYEELDSDFEDFAGRSLIQRFEFEEPWPTWEMHPHGEEFVYLLSGRVEFDLQAPGAAPESLQLERPGQFVLVPRGVWHTARPRGRTAMLFVTPGQGTQNAELPPV